MTAKEYSDIQTETGPDGSTRLALFLTEEDALNVYKALSGVQFHDARVDHLERMISSMFERTFDNRLTEPWEWEE